MGITVGRDHNIWFTEPGQARISRITLSGKVTHFRLPDSQAFPVGITAGHDGGLWFTEPGASKIGRLIPLHA